MSGSKVVFCFFVLLIAVSCSNAQSLKQIYEPYFIGSPPDNAFNELIKLPDGEIRHYGFAGDWFNPSSHIYIYSRDDGKTWSKKTLTDPDLFTNENMPPAVCSPYSGDFIRLIGTKDGTYVMRSLSGIDGPYQKTRIDSEPHDMVRQPVFLKTCNRILVTCGRSIIQNDVEVMQSCVYYSDDDGHTWRISNLPVGPHFITEWPHQKPRWQNYAIEPTIVELTNGRIWMLLRTSTDRLYESFSTDHGETWSEPAPSRFYSTLTMPTLFRMKDGRILLFFCSTTPLPEVDRSTDTTIREEQKYGLWEDVFTNRDVLHSAVSDDDGKTWSGFRELYLDPLRNESDFATRGGTEASLDKSVHQTQAVELAYGKILVAFGQHPLVRGMIIFDPDWLNQKICSNDFEDGLKKWTTFRYLKGIKGHCAYNRDPGPSLVDDPDNSSTKVLQIRHISNPALVCDVDGAVWNFTAAPAGSFTTKIYLVQGGRGGSISLLDRWFNPTDTLAYRYSMYSLKFDGEGNSACGVALNPGRWNMVKFEWTNLHSESCRMSINGKSCSKVLSLNIPSANGINYVQFQSVNDIEDKKGFFVREVKAIAR